MTDPQTAADAAERVSLTAAQEARAYLSTPVTPKWFGRELVSKLLAEHDEMAAELEQVRGELDRRSRLASALRDRRAAAATPTPTNGKRTPEQWCAEYGIDIRDPDGWRGKGDPPWEQPITLPDFFRRAVRSTCWRVTTDVWNRISREAYEAADAERSDAEGAGKGPESHGDAIGVEGTPQRTWTTPEAPQGPPEGDDASGACEWCNIDTHRMGELCNCAQFCGSMNCEAPGESVPELVKLFRRPRVTPPADEMTS